jgi:hypothetical protein
MKVLVEVEDSRAPFFFELMRNIRAKSRRLTPKKAEIMDGLRQAQGSSVEYIEPAEPAGIWDELKEFDGMADDLPEDLAANLDHYIHGHPRS